MEDTYRVLAELPKNISLSATTKTLNIKVTKASITGNYTIDDMQAVFLEKLTWAYYFENIIIRNMPKVCKNYQEIIDTRYDGDDDSWKRQALIFRWGKIFNLFFKVFTQYKTAKKQSCKDEKRAFLTALLSLDDVELWEIKHPDNIYSVPDLIKWYNKHIDPFAAILIDPDIVGDFE